MRRFLDGAVPDIREASGRGREVLVVVKHSQTLLGRDSSDQQIDSGQRAGCAAAKPADTPPAQA